MITRLTVKLPDTLCRRAKAAATLRGETVSDAIRTFLEEYTAEAEEAKGIRAIQEIETSGLNEDWDILTQLVKDCAVETGISDLAHQHDHYLYGKPKKE